MKSHSLSVIILAAGKGTRMKSHRAKVLHEVFFAPMVQHVIDAVASLQPVDTTIVIGHQGDTVKDTLKKNNDLTFAIQENQLGTGHAVLSAQDNIKSHDGVVMILCGDTPLLKSETLREMFDYHLSTNATITLMTTVLDNPTNYGRIFCDATGKISEIVEQKDCQPEQLSIQEINGGIYCVDKDFLFSALNKVGTDNSQGEVYLTDIIKIAVSNGRRVEKFRASTPIDILGVNSRIELAAAQKELSMRRNDGLMDQGVTMYNPESITVCPHSTIGIDSILHSGVTISNNSSIGESCVISQGTIVDNCRIGDNVTIEPYCRLVNTEISEGTDVKYTANQS